MNNGGVDSFCLNSALADAISGFDAMRWWLFGVYTNSD
jgi:hypothetical protein